jgi:hypothetical protein
MKNAHEYRIGGGRFKPWELHTKCIPNFGGELIRLYFSDPTKPDVMVDGSGALSVLCHPYG